MNKQLFLVFCAAFFCSTSAQINYIRLIVPNTVDIRSIGMGKTESAGNTGSNAIFGNPSLLALQQNGTVKLGSALRFGFIKDEYNEKLSNSTNDEIKSGYKPNYKFTSISAAIPLHLNMSIPFSIAFGAGYHNAIDLSYSQYYKRESIGLADFFQDEETIRARGGLNTISPSFAFSFFNCISAGVSMHIGFGKTRSEYISSHSTIVTGSELESNTTISGKSFSSTFGLTGKPVKNLTLGTSITPPYKWTWYDIEKKRKSNNTRYNDIEIAGGEFTIPLKFSVSCEYQITEKFSIAVEYQTRPFKSFKLDAEKVSYEYDYANITSDDDLSDMESIIKEMDLKNGHVLHAGIEIYANNIPFRFGFFIEPFPTTSEELKNNTVKLVEKPNKEIGGTFGFSAPVTQALFLELSAQYGLLKYIAVDYNLSNSSRYKEYVTKNHNLRVDLGFRVDLPAFPLDKSAETSRSPSTGELFCFDHQN